MSPESLLDLDLTLRGELTWVVYLSLANPAALSLLLSRMGIRREGKSWVLGTQIEERSLVTITGKQTSPGEN